MRLRLSTRITQRTRPPTVFLSVPRRTVRPGRPGRGAAAGSPRGRGGGPAPARSGTEPRCDSPSRRPVGGRPSPGRPARAPRRPTAPSRRARRRPPASPGRRPARTTASHRARTAPRAARRLGGHRRRPRRRRRHPLEPGEPPQPVGQAGAVVRHLQVRRGQPFGEGDGPGVAVAGLAGPAQVAECVPGGVQRESEGVAIIGDVRAIPGQGLEERASRLQLGQRLGGSPVRGEEVADPAVTHGQVAAVSGYVGVLGDQGPHQLLVLPLLAQRLRPGRRSPRAGRRAGCG